MSSDRGRGRGRGRGDAPQSYQGGQAVQGTSRGGGAPRGGTYGGGGRGEGGGRGGGDRGRGFGDRGRGFGDRGRGFGDRGRGGRGGGGGGRGAIFEPDHVPQPDPAVTKFEDELVQNPASFIGALSVKDSLPRRSEYSTAGTKVVVRTNHFNVTIKDPTAVVYRYNITFGSSKKGDEPSRRQKQRYVELLMKQAPFQSVVHATDYTANIFTVQQLKFPGNANKQEYKMTMYQQFERPMQDSPNDTPERAAARVRKTRQMTIERTGSYSLNDLFEYVRSPGTNAYASKGDVIQALNIIFNQASNANEHIVAMSGNKFYPFKHSNAFYGNHALTESANLGEGLIALRGYYSSIRPGPSRITLNLNVSTGAFFEPINLLDLMNNFLGNRPRNRENMKRLEAFIRRLKVVTTYVTEPDPKIPKAKRPIIKVRTVMGFARNQTDSKATTFKVTEGGAEKTKSVADHFSQQYGVTIRNLQAPVINCGLPRDPIYMPAELCTVLAGQPCQRLLSGEQTAQMIRFAARYPNLNAQSIQTNGIDIMKLAQAEQANTISRFGLGMDVDMLTIQGRKLDDITIMFKKGLKTRDASWNLANQQFHTPSIMKGSFSSLVVFSTRAGDSTDPPEKGAEFNKLASTFAQAASRYGLKPGPVVAPAAAVADSMDFDKNVKAFAEKFSLAKTKGINWVLVIIPTKSTGLYAAIKTAADHKVGIHTVVIQASNARKMLEGDAGMIANLALKFSVKSGGKPWALQEKDLPEIDNQTMVVGLDVTHPNPGAAKSAPSIAAIVASYDRTLSNWPADGTLQGHRVEAISGLADLMHGRLKYFASRNKGQSPKKVIVFRDGVSEGQYKTVLTLEFPAMQEAYKRVYGDEKNWPKTSIIICGKRHHTRFYPTKESDSDVVDRGGFLKGSWNLKPGLVVDRGITGSGDGVFDFFMQPHKALQGTAKPCHYIVLKNETGMTPSKLEQTIHTMSHGFYRATKAVSYCPAAYCADKAADRFRMYLHESMKESFDDSASSQSGSTGGAQGLTTGGWNGGVHPAHRDVMFYF